MHFSRHLIGLAAMVYEPLYHARSKETIKLCSDCFAKRNQQDIAPIILIVFNKTIIPLALVGYEMIIANSALHASLAILIISSNECS